MDDDLLAQLGAELCRRREAAGLTQSDLAACLTGWERESVRTIISKCERGRVAPSPAILHAIDGVLGADGTPLSSLGAAQRRSSRRRTTASAPIAIAGAPTTAEEDPTDRRTAIGAAGLAAIAALAGDRLRQIATDDAHCDVLSLIETEEAIERYATTYTLVPHATLFEEIAERWHKVDVALGGRTSLGTRRRLTAAGGRLTYYLSRLSFNLGDLSAAGRLAELADRYATQVEDRVILASIAGMRSGIAYYRKDYGGAASAFESPDPPYSRARNAAYRARAYAAQGDASRALAELDVMRHSPIGQHGQPGDLPLSEAAASMFEGVVLCGVGAGEAAEQAARESIAGHQAAGPAAHLEEWGHALLVLAAALVRRDRPEVDEAAAVAAQAMVLMESRPTHTVLDRARRFRDELTSFRTVPAVRDFHELVASAPRPALVRGV
ncbi:helix-turn-helix domain-containing protein [Frankia sp. AgB1.9]|uniref:helix-turn-helix domain-containing protein n=1 Tax=unclassified Frankia TaxID=2632575 RepID=UPI00193382E5|nr:MULTISPECIES: helix-turn-helix transcriptional regulator [unclassified Frankia]MBL7491325.1 helix-turn-helix domain-containing protein [Frankia sp. AgW1.1]MBL7546603.1 helix-turn-helix domain-containing protein [Frankia sp. AgB1.9]MBL7624663.1 helix-turn-helix domain-containing protein [Frankia sp. AgB1.8]